MSDFKTTDLGNAKRFIARHSLELRHISQWGWLYWDGIYWRKDDTGEVIRRAKETVMAIYEEASKIDSLEERRTIVQHALRSEGEVSLRRMVALAQSEIDVVATPSRFDVDPFLFNCLNGTIDLRTGALREHRSADHITKIAPVKFDVDAKCPRWVSFLNKIMNGNKVLIQYLQKLAGYSLTGDTREQSLTILYGGGQNGKSTFINVLRRVLGNYALQAQAETFMVRQNERIPNDLARLTGARLVTVQEIEAGRRLAESLVKSLTGGDIILARFLHREFFEYKPQFKIILITNHKPVIRGHDLAIWRRMRLVPYDVTIPTDEQDKELETKMLLELPGILSWAVEGCLLWQREGLGLPDEVQIATSAYRDEMADSVCHFLSDTCIVDNSGRIPAKHLYNSYQQWCLDNSEDAVEQRLFKRKMQDFGFRQKRSSMSGGREWHGIRFTDVTDDLTLKTPFFSIDPPYGKNQENNVTPSVVSVNDREILI